jgi:glycosyltransferase involved in cell wall biosynthesis
MEPDWVFVSSHSFAHQISSNQALVNKRGMVYVHTPARYIWSPEVDGRGGNPIVKRVAASFKSMDNACARESSYTFVANSINVQDRIAKYWGKEVKVVYPPVRVNSLRDLVNELSTNDGLEELRRRFNLPSNYILGAGRFIHYKRFDTVLDFGARTGLPVVLLGGGPLYKFLTEHAKKIGVNLMVLRDLSDTEFSAVVAGSEALIFPGEEDFGIIPVEAMAMGVPVIALNRGGAQETVQHGVSGFLVDDFDQVDHSKVLERASKLDKREITLSVSKFDESYFEKWFESWRDSKI